MLFQNQRTVDVIVDRLCLTLGCSRASLHVCASPRSVVLGPLQFVLRSRSIETRASQRSTGEQLIPDPAYVQTVRTSAAWVVVVEKHAVYQTLCASDFLAQAKRYGVTGLGLLMTVQKGIDSADAGQGISGHGGTLAPRRASHDNARTHLHPGRRWFVAMVTN